MAEDYLPRYDQRRVDEVRPQPPRSVRPPSSC